MHAFIHNFLARFPVAVAVVGGIALLDYAYFILLPRFAVARYGKSDPERLRRLLERVAATPSLFGASQKLTARLMLVGIYFQKGQHAEVVSQCRACIDSLSGVLLYFGLFRSVEAEFRRRLADSLEALGRADEAAAERRRAEELVERAGSSALRHLTRGKLLERQNRYEEAYEEYQRALDRTPAAKTRRRVECTMHLVLAGYHAGRPADCLRWAEQAVALGAQGPVLRSAHRMAALACGSLSRLEAAEQHYQRAHDLAAAADDRPAAAESLALLAGCLRKRGRLVAAADACTRAAALDPKAERMSLAVRVEIFHALGRYDDALETIRQHRQVNPYTLPHDERRVRAAGSLDAARIAAECGRADDAWRHIQEALGEFGTDAKLGFKCEAALALVHAARGDAAESRRLATAAESRLADFDRDPGTRRGVLYDLGMAAAVRGDHPAGIRCWTAYLALNPDPVYHPVALYHRGEAHRQLGHLDDARADYRAAVATDIDCHFAGLARRRLSDFAFQ